MLNITDKHNIYTDNEVFIKPDYLNHPYISGNKYRKLKYNIREAKQHHFKRLITFGGAFSNHIVAVASAGKEFGFETLGIIRGEELSREADFNPTLSFAKSCGMNFRFVTRSEYRQKSTKAYMDNLQNEFKDAYIIPEGGTNTLAVKGCEEILTTADKDFDYVCCPVGTGGTISGIINSSQPHQKILGFPALKGDFLQEDISKFARNTNWDLITDYHFGGYAKINTELISFINQFKESYGIPLDPIYTGKMMYGILDLKRKGFFQKGSKILAIHTGGLQGIGGMNLRLKKQQLPQIV